VGQGVGGREGSNRRGTGAMAPNPRPSSSRSRPRGLPGTARDARKNAEAQLGTGMAEGAAQSAGQGSAGRCCQPSPTLQCACRLPRRVLARAGCGPLYCSLEKRREWLYVVGCACSGLQGLHGKCRTRCRSEPEGGGACADGTSCATLHRATPLGAGPSHTGTSPSTGREFRHPWDAAPSRASRCAWAPVHAAGRGGARPRAAPTAHQCVQFDATPRARGARGETRAGWRGRQKVQLGSMCGGLRLATAPLGAVRPGGPGEVVFRSLQPGARCRRQGGAGRSRKEGKMAQARSAGQDLAARRQAALP
jgi:hypothetical protein